MKAEFYIGVVNPNSGAEAFEKFAASGRKEDVSFALTKKKDEMVTAVGGAYVMYDAAVISEDYAKRDFSLFSQWVSENRNKVFCSSIIL